MHRHALQTPPKQGPFGDTSFGGVVLILGRIPDAFERFKDYRMLGLLYGSKAQEFSRIMQIDLILQCRRYKSTLELSDFRETRKKTLLQRLFPICPMI